MFFLNEGYSKRDGKSLKCVSPSIAHLRKSFSESAERKCRYELKANACDILKVGGIPSVCDGVSLCTAASCVACICDVLLCGWELAEVSVVVMLCTTGAGVVGRDATVRLG